MRAPKLYYHNEPFRMMGPTNAEVSNICGGCGKPYRKNAPVVKCSLRREKKHRRGFAYCYMHQRCAERHPRNIVNIDPPKQYSKTDAVLIHLLHDLYQQNPSAWFRGEPIARYLGLNEDTINCNLSRLDTEHKALLSKNTRHPSGKNTDWYKYQFNPAFNMDDWEISARSGAYQGPIPAECPRIFG